jgi:hypothetical protein
MSSVVVESRFSFLVAVDRVASALFWCGFAFCSSGSSSASLARVVEQFRGMVLRMSRCGLYLSSGDGGVGYGVGSSVGASGFPNFPVDRDVSSCFLRLYAEGIIIGPQVSDGGLDRPSVWWPVVLVSFFPFLVCLEDGRCYFNVHVLPSRVDWATNLPAYPMVGVVEQR